MRRKITFILAIAGAFLISPCSSPLAAASDACSLLTQARVSMVLGVPVGAGDHIIAKTPSMCGWAQASDTNHQGKRVMLTVLEAIGSRTPVDRFNTGKTPIKGITKTPTTGIGDDAYYVTTPGLGTGLSVKKGNSVFEIRVYGFPVEQIKTLEKTLAQDVLAKI
jgi:hypothetical protein